MKIHLNNFSIKVIKRKNLNREDVNLLKKEAEILKGLAHENIVQFKHVSPNSFNKF